MVPTDRPGPALQMIDNFLKQADYDTPVPYSMDRKPLLHQYRVSSGVWIKTDLNGALCE